VELEIRATTHGLSLELQRSLNQQPYPVPASRKALYACTVVLKVIG